MQKSNNFTNYISVDSIKLKIQLLMTQKKLTQNDLAKVLDVDISTFNKKINGISEWRLTECMRLADFFGVEMGEIFLTN